MIWLQVFYDPHDEAAFRAKLRHYAVDAPQDAQAVAARYSRVVLEKETRHCEETLHIAGSAKVSGRAKGKPTDPNYSPVFFFAFSIYASFGFHWGGG